MFPGCIVTWAWSLAKGQYMVSWLLTGAPEQRYWQNRETANVAQLVEPRHVNPEVAGSSPALVNFSLVHPNLSKICTQSVSLVVYYMISFVRKDKLRLLAVTPCRNSLLSSKYITQKKLKEHVDIMIFIEHYPLKRCQGCVKLIASKVNCFLNITDLSEVQLCMSSNSWTWECPHTKDGADHVPLIFLSSVVLKRSGWLQLWFQWAACLGVRNSPEDDQGILVEMSSSNWFTTNSLYSLKIIIIFFFFNCR